MARSKAVLTSPALVMNPLFLVGASAAAPARPATVGRLLKWRVVALITFVGSVATVLPGSVEGAETARNVVVILADDLGVDAVRVYGESPVAGPSPHLTALASQGVLFRNAWAYPVCSPTRVSVFTGVHPTRHGVGIATSPYNPDGSVGLDPTRPNLARHLAARGYRTAAVGKWHMAGDVETQLHPGRSGFGYYAGFLWGSGDYFNWPKTVNGSTKYNTTYITRDIANEAIAQLGGTEPFFLWVAFTAPHLPFHEPPADLHSFDLAGIPIEGNEPLYFKAMLEAMDSEMGRFLSYVDWSDTTVVFLGDNGTQRVNLEPPFNQAHGKGTVYESGVNIPLIITGQAVPPDRRGSESQALVQATDLFATILEIAGMPGSADDSLSLVPYLLDPATPSRRPWVFTELFLPNGGPIDPTTHLQAARGSRYKVVRNGLQRDQLYDLQLDPFERAPIRPSLATGPEQAAYVELTRVIDASGAQCGDGVDNDGDALEDSADPACASLSSAREYAKCQDGLNNDAAEDRLVDFDGGQSIHGLCAAGVCPPGVSDPDGDGIANRDPQCASPWQQREGRGCGLGFELILVAPLLTRLGRRSGFRGRGHCLAGCVTVT